MRRLLALLIALAVVVAVLGVADVVVRHAVESRIASRLESREAGATAHVRISSWPFVGRLAASGSVPGLDAEVTGLRVGPFAVDAVNIAVRDLKVSRSDLFRGHLVVRSVRAAAITAVISQRSIDAGTGLPVTLGAGTVGLAGVQARARIAVAGGRLTITVAPLPTLTLPLLPSALLPCTPAAAVTPGRITVACITNTIPPALAATAPGTP